jgi:hypothetical protein
MIAIAMKIVSGITAISVSRVLSQSAVVFMPGYWLFFTTTNATLFTHASVEGDNTLQTRGCKEDQQRQKRS